MKPGPICKGVADCRGFGYPGLVWCPAQVGRIGNVVQLHNVPNAVRWMGSQMPLAARLGKARPWRKPSQKTGQTEPGMPKASGSLRFCQGEYHV